MNDKTQDVQTVYPEGSFSRLRAARAKDPRKVRWHPMIIRWCPETIIERSLPVHQNSGFYRSFRATGLYIGHMNNS